MIWNSALEKLSFLARLIISSIIPSVWAPDIYFILWAITQSYCLYFVAETVAALAPGGALPVGSWVPLTWPHPYRVWGSVTAFEHFLTLWLYRILQAHVVRALPQPQIRAFPHRALVLCC